VAGKGFTSDAAAMTRAITGFDESATNVRDSMRTLERDLQSTLASYRGAQAQAFWQLHRRLHEDMTLASRELDTMSRLVDSSRRNYDTSDAESASSMTSLASQVDGGGGVLGRLSGA
jgi:WXG100 family type VII secretion target